MYRHLILMKSQVPQPPVGPKARELLIEEEVEQLEAERQEEEEIGD